MKQKIFLIIRRAIRLLLGAATITAILAVLFVLYPRAKNSLSSVSPQTITTRPIASAAPAFVDSFPWGQLILGVVFALFGLLFIDQWRELRKRIETLEQGKGEAVSKATDAIKGQIDKFTETETRRLDQMHARLIRIREDHPWIVGLSENDFIPSIPSCRLVLITTKSLLEDDKLSLAYEYIYSWLDGNSKFGKLRGTLEQFYELMEFCEAELKDRYLALLIYAQIDLGVVDRELILPDYIRYLCMTGHHKSAHKLYTQLEKIATPSFWRQFRTGNRTHPLMLQPAYAFRANAALSMYCYMDGRYADESRHWNASMDLAEKSNVSVLSGDFVEWAKAEHELVVGEPCRAYDIIKRLKTSGIPREFRYLIAMIQERTDVEKSDVYAD